MNNTHFEIRCHPKSAEDEMKFHRAMPTVWSDSSVVLLNDYGATLCRSDGESIPIDLPDGDEVVLGRGGEIYACWFDNREFKVQFYHFDGESFEAIPQMCAVDISNLPVDNLVVLGVPEGVELWIDTPDTCRRIWTISREGAKKNPAIITDRPDGELLFSSGAVLGFAEDRGVRGRFLTIIDLGSQKTWKIRSEFAFTALGRVFAIASGDLIDDDERFGLHVFSCENTSFLQVNGPILEAGGNDDYATLSVFTGDDADLYNVTENDDGDLILRQCESHSGYKSLSLDGTVYAVRGFSDSVTIASISNYHRTQQKHSPSMSRPMTQQQAGRCIVSRAVGNAVGTVIHFHGGPESLEVPEARLFGLPQWCNDRGVDWIGVNYQGSLMPDRSYTRSAWHRWRSAIHEDLSQAMELASGPVVLAGWSFGGTLAIALAASFRRIKGLFVGAVTGDLRKHVEYAMSIDPEHRDWFSRRFDLDDDALFFNGLHGFRADVSVLEIHGVNDMQCPAFLANQVAQQWEELGNPWTRVWLPGGGHYASTPTDVELISQSAHSFITRVLCEES